MPYKCYLSSIKVPGAPVLCFICYVASAQCYVLYLLYSRCCMLCPLYVPYLSSTYLLHMSQVPGFCPLYSYDAGVLCLFSIFYICCRCPSSVLYLLCCRCPVFCTLSNKYVAGALGLTSTHLLYWMFPGFCPPCYVAFVPGSVLYLLHMLQVLWFSPLSVMLQVPCGVHSIC